MSQYKAEGSPPLLRTLPDEGRLDALPGCGFTLIQSESLRTQHFSMAGQAMVGNLNSNTDIRSRLKFCHSTSVALRRLGQLIV